MKIVILLKNGPNTDEAGRALQTAKDMLEQGHDDVRLYLLQEAVRFGRPRAGCSNSTQLRDLIDKHLEVSVLAGDAGLRGMDFSTAGSAPAEGSYEDLVDLMTSCDRVVGIL